ncbi:hypothetical protein [Streptomyces abyssalis]|uniref:hypothetical protein n=1 Tax=Streptomyces abyssalis TaxID=933944 RepID=UPI001112F470|nr:hypothetical protein [Streptomyces abyssalis]
MTSLHVSVEGNDRSSIIIAGGSVNTSGKPPLPSIDIPRSDIEAVRKAWVPLTPSGDNIPTATEAAELLDGIGPGIAVVSGPPGFGKRAIGIRALSKTSRILERRGRQALLLKEIRPDWETPETPDTSLLPDEPGTGYLLDVAAEIGAWKDQRRVANELISHGEALRRIGSYLVVISDEAGWPEEVSGTLAKVVVRVKGRPSPHLVARAHLERVHCMPERGQWLKWPTNDSEMVGEAAHLLSDRSSPADATRLAGILASVDYTPAGLASAIEQFQQWTAEVDSVFKRTLESPDDRALLIAAIFLSGEDPLAIQSAARKLLNEAPVRDVRTILSGPDLTARLEGVGVEVAGRRANVDHKPGYARAVLLHLWRQRADIHGPLLEWVDTITGPRQPGVIRLEYISDLLVQLAVAESDIRVIDQIRNWIDNGNDSVEHQQLIADVLTTAAEADIFGPAVRARLLTWAQDDSEAVARVVALVCQGAFADRYPRQAMVRLRHILSRRERDSAVRIAEEALHMLALREMHLPRVWESVTKWTKEGNGLAGHRAFLSLVDPYPDPSVVQLLLEAAGKGQQVRDALVDSWSAALADPRVDTECRQLLIAWARVRSEGLVAKHTVTDILQEVVRRHLYSSPISALVFGEPEIRYDHAVIELRKDLRLPSSENNPHIGEDAVES